MGGDKWYRMNGRERMGQNDEWEGKNGKGKKETMSGRERMEGEKWYRMNWRERRRQNE